MANLNENSLENSILIENEKSLENSILIENENIDIIDIEDLNNAIWLVDKNGEDDNSSIMGKLFKSDNTAFSEPNLILSYINKIPADKTINIVITTNGGALSHTEKILKALLKHEAGYRVYIKNECYSAGAIIAIGAKEIIMNDYSYIGKIDPQLYNGVNTIQLIIYKNMPEKYIKGDNYFKYKEAEYVLNYMDKIIDLINIEKNIKKNIYDHLIYSELPHCALFDKNKCKNIIKLNVREPTDLEKNTIYSADKVKINKYKNINKFEIEKKSFLGTAKNNKSKILMFLGLIPFITMAMIYNLPSNFKV